MTAAGDRPAAGMVLRPDGVTRQQAAVVGGSVVLDGAAADRQAPVTTLDGARCDYFVQGLPVEIHCHSIGRIDLSDIRAIDLHGLDAAAAAEGVACVPTMYLAHGELDSFVAFMKRFHDLRQRGLLPFVPAVALEGPLLASHGGTPSATVWPPTRVEWERLAACGALGLAYVVVSPDGLTPDSDLHDHLGPEHPDLAWIVHTLVAAGVRPALGHYTKKDAGRAAELTYELVDAAWQGESPIVGARVVTDHLFNDMPLTIRHAFRTRAARARRESLIAGYDLPSWNLADLPEQVGAVPAAIMRLCHEGRVVSCINFDGEHVDLAIAARAVEVIGQGSVMLMTDRCDAARLGGQDLHREPGSSLWYQDGGVVAAGSQPLDRQLRGARSVGVPESRLWDLVCFTAYSALGLDRDPWLAPANAGSFVTVDADQPDAREAYTRHAVVNGAPQLYEDRGPAVPSRTPPIITTHQKVGTQ